MSRRSKWVVVLGLVATMLAGSATGASSAFADGADAPTPGTIVTMLLGPGVCC